MTGVVCAIVGNSVVTAVAEVIRLKKGITAVGNAQVDTAQSKFGGSSLLLSGTDRIQTSTSEAFTGNFTMELWVRFSSLAGEYQVIINNGTTETNPRVNILMNYSTIWVSIATEPLLITGSQTLSTNTWYHLALVRSGSTVTLYKDGTSIGTATNSNTLGLTNGYTIGPNSSQTSSWAGSVDEVRISNTARYTTTFTPSTTPFVNDANTLLLLHMDGTDASTYFEDDNGQRSQKGVYAIGNAQVDTAQSQFGGASYLGDGSSDSLTVTADTVFNFGTSDYTVECWIRSASLAATRIIFDSGIATQGTRPVFYVTTDGRINIYTTATGAVSSANGIINTNAWYHVALVRYNGTTNIYVDGVSRASTGTSYNMSTTATMWIGAESPGTTNSWNGHIDEFRVSNTARYTAGFTAPTAAFVNDANTLLLLHMDGTDASTVFEDDVGVRAPKGITALGNAQVDTAQSKFGGASALFDGTGDYLDLYPRDTLMRWNDSNHTIETFVRINSFTGISAGSDLPVLYGLKFVDAGGNYWSFGPISTGAVRFYYFNGSSQTLTTTGITLTTNTWYHIAFVRNGTSIKIYVDGTERASGTVSGTPQYVADHPMSLGMYANNSFNGHIDEFRVSNTARYTAGFTPTTTPFQNDANTLLLLHCDGTDTSTVFIDDNGVTATHSYT